MAPDDHEQIVRLEMTVRHLQAKVDALRDEMLADRKKLNVATDTINTANAWRRAFLYFVVAAGAVFSGAKTAGLWLKAWLA